MTERTRKMLWTAGCVIFLLFCAAVGIFIGIPMVRLARSPEHFRLWVDSFGVWSRVVFVGMVFLQVMVALIPGEPLELAAGYAFGSIEGMALAMAGILLGSWAVFAGVRFLGPKFAAVFFPEQEIRRLAFLKNPKKSFLLVFLLMLVPGTPKDLLSWFAGLTPLTTAQWLGIVAVARIPSVLTSVLAGAAVGERAYSQAALLLALTAAISILGILWYRLLCAKEEK